VFTRPSRSRCSTTTAVTRGSANSRPTFARDPFIPDPTSTSTPHHRPARLSGPARKASDLTIQVRLLIVRGHPGLAATAWTKDLGRAHRLAKRLKAGTVGLNCQMQFDHSMPFGGYKQSGWGYESGKAGIETYLQNKIVWAQM
jgi:hypothetical protein